MENMETEQKQPQKEQQPRQRESSLWDTGVFAKPGEARKVVWFPRSHKTNNIEKINYERR